MSEKLTEWQKLSKVYERIENEPGQWRNDVIEFSVIMHLRDMIQSGEKAFMAIKEEPGNEGGNTGFSVMQLGNSKYFVLFPDEETAGKLGEKCSICTTKQVLEYTAEAEDIAGIRLVYGVDSESGKYSAGLITKKMAVIAISEIQVQ